MFENSLVADCGFFGFCDFEFWVGFEASDDFELFGFVGGVEGVVEVDLVPVVHRLVVADVAELFEGHLGVAVGGVDAVVAVRVDGALGAVGFDHVVDAFHQLVWAVAVGFGAADVVVIHFVLRACHRFIHTAVDGVHLGKSFCAEKLLIA